MNKTDLKGVLDSAAYRALDSAEHLSRIEPAFAAQRNAREDQLKRVWAAASAAASAAAVQAAAQDSQKQAEVKQAIEWWHDHTLVSTECAHALTCFDARGCAVTGFAWVCVQ